LSKALNNEEISYFVQPTKGEKEGLRSLYDRYHALNEMLTNTEHPKEEDSVDVELEDVDALKKEKKELQHLLIKYQTDFANQNRRPVQFVQDREPLQKEYARYKTLKKAISLIECEK